MVGLVALVLFGILQGLTEFLPVSSSGHLALFQYFSRSIDEHLSLNIAVHVGTLLTVLIFYRSDIRQILSGLKQGEKEAVAMTLQILVASLPTAIIGLLLKKHLYWALTNPVVAASCLIVTGLILFFSDRIQVSESFQSGFGVGVMPAFLVGVVQGFAVLPGISRSGSTIVAGLCLGMNPKNASRFSFLISVPAIAGAGLLEVLELESGVDWGSLLVGALVSFLVGMFAIAWMVRVTLKGGLRPFSYYVFVLSGLFFVCYGLGIGENIF
jgi:undecaprenyl-diphosphatase